MWEGFMVGTIIWVGPALLAWLLIGPYKLFKSRKH